MKSPLEKIQEARTDAMIASFGSLSDSSYQKAFNEFADPGRKVLRKLRDDDLAALISAEPTSKQGLIAASILRQRESWRTPARWSLIISVISLCLATAAFARTL